MNKTEEAAKNLSSRNFTEAKVDLAKGNIAKGYDSYLGYAAITLDRKGFNNAEYVLNGHGLDGWFRRQEGIGAGYGLAVRDIKVTTKKPETFGNPISKSNYTVYKVKVQYLPISEDYDDPSKYETALGHLWVYKDTTLEEVLTYINKNKHKWVP